MKALILAGGRGSRLNDFTKDQSKSLVKIYEKPLIEYNLDQAIEAGVSEILITVCYKQEQIMKALGKEYKGVKITYIKEGFSIKALAKKGLVDAIETARKAIGNDDFILMLGDEIVVDAKIKEMVKKFRDEDLFAICGIIFEEDRLSIRKTYSAMVNEKGRAFRMIEKPKVKINNIKGTGHCIFKNEILDYLERTPINAYRGQKEMVDMIQVAIDDAKKVYVYPITKDYVNVNIKEDYDLAKDMIKKNNPKVLIVHNQMKYYGGAELLIVELANWLTKRGIKNDILALSKSRKVENDLINTEIITPYHDIDLRPPGYKNMRDIFKAIKVFRKKLKEIKDNYDIINFHDFPVTWTLWPRRKPTVWFMNQPPNLWSKPDAGLFLKGLNKLRILADWFMIRKSMDEICVLDEFNKKRAFQRYGRDSTVVYCGVNYDFFSKGDRQKAIKDYGLKGKFIVMQSGQISGIKNQMASIKAVEKIKDKIPNILLVLTGKEDPEYKKQLDEYIKEKKLEKYVKYIIMFGERDKLRNLYKVADIGLFPIGKQGGWIAPFEMLSAGIPIIVSSDMGSSPIIKKNNLGIVTKEYDKAILEIYENQKEYKKQAEKNRIFIKKNLTWENYAEKMIESYKKAWKKYK
ncbi:MAG: sugar phosphate nucleotidyltransferase [archaeon]